MAYSQRDREIDQLCKKWWHWYGELAKAIVNPKKLEDKKKYAQLCSQKCREYEGRLAKYGLPKKRMEETSDHGTNL